MICWESTCLFHSFLEPKVLVHPAYPNTHTNGRVWAGWLCSWRRALLSADAPVVARSGLDFLGGGLDACLLLVGEDRFRLRSVRPPCLGSGRWVWAWSRSSSSRGVMTVARIPVS